jgi:hypothetical protein
LDSVKESDRYLAPGTLCAHTQKLANSGLLKPVFDSVNQNLAKLGNVNFSPQR